MGVFNLINTAVQISASNITADPATIFLTFSLVITVICTALIIFRIVRLGYQSADSPYRNVIEIVVESAFLYSISLILYLPLYVQTDLRLNYMSEYLKRIVFAMTVRLILLVFCSMMLTKYFLCRRSLQLSSSLELQWALLARRPPVANKALASLPVLGVEFSPRSPIRLPSSQRNRSRQGILMRSLKVHGVTGRRVSIEWRRRTFVPFRVYARIFSLECRDAGYTRPLDCVVLVLS
jgi:hypothetical protein